jgi:hypothetical protein
LPDGQQDPIGDSTADNIDVIFADRLRSADHTPIGWWTCVNFFHCSLLLAGLDMSFVFLHVYLIE